VLSGRSGASGVCAVTGDHESARDAVQETFLRVFRSLERWKGESTLRTWIVRIAVRSAIDQRRRSWRHRGGNAPAPEPSHDPRAEIENALALRRVQELAEEVGGQQGLILRLRLLGGLGNQEVAEALGLEPANVRMQLSKAIRRLREKL
jgi:RNA polymerase sigma-70 factor (ECF subfamily)